MTAPAARSATTISPGSSSAKIAPKNAAANGSGKPRAGRPAPTRAREMDAMPPRFRRRKGPSRRALPGTARPCPGGSEAELELRKSRKSAGEHQ